MKFSLHTAIITVILSTCIFPQANTQDIKAHFISETIVIDGELNEAIYDSPPISGFTQRDPDEGEPATQETRVWVRYDEEYLYVAAHLLDTEPAKIDENLARRDSWFDTDRFVVYLDPHHDKRTGYFFWVNPGGALGDGVLMNDGWDDSSWDGIWEYETRIDETGWYVEMKIPFSQMRFNERENMVWGINFEREIKRNHESAFYQFIPKDAGGFVSLFPELYGLNKVEPEQRFEVIPYIVQKAQYLKHDANDPFYTGNQYKTSIGADVKLSLGSGLNLDAAFYPDFGQVEVDPAVINLSASETYYREKRPFFIEGRRAFYFGNQGVNNNWGFNFANAPNLLYSRRIGSSPTGDVDIDNSYVDYPQETNIIGAGKLTGKIGNWTVGALSAVTERMFAEVDTNGYRFDKEVEPFTHYGVLRLNREYDEGRFGTGVMFTGVNRDLGNGDMSGLLSKEAYTYGLDGWWTLDEENTWVMNSSVVGSYVAGTKDYMIDLQQEFYRYLQRPDRDYFKLDSNRMSMQGFYTRTAINKQKGNFYLNAAVGAASPGLEYNDLGYQWMADRINSHLVLGYRWYEPDNIFRRKMIYLSHFRSINFEGDPTASGLFLSSFFQFMNYYDMRLRVSIHDAAYNATSTRGGPMVLDPLEGMFSVSFESDNREKIIASIGYEFFGNVDGLVYNEYDFEIKWKPNTQIQFSVEPEYTYKTNPVQYVGKETDPFAAETYGTRYIFGELHQHTVSSSIRLDWAFTPKLSLQMYIQPLFSVGEYVNIKELSQPRTSEYHVYGTGNSTISYDESDEEYSIDPDGNGSAGSFTVSDPNFNFKSLRGNIVLRWEVLPGSVFYLVWNHNRTNYRDPGDFDFNRDFDNLLHSQSDNIYMMKFSYWFDV